MAKEHEKPTTQDISKIARDFGFNLKEEEVEIYSKLLFCEEVGRTLFEGT